MKYLPKILVILLFVFSNSIAEEQKDIPLSLEGGKIVGLPKKYLPASFDLDTLTLRVSDKKLVFPDTLKSLLMYHDAGDDPFVDSSRMKPRPYTYKFGYHENNSNGLIRYISILIFSKKSESYFKLLVQLDDLNFIEANVQVSALGAVPIDLNGIPDKPKKK